MKENTNRKAITIKEIKGNSIETIPIGTKFIIIHYGEEYSSCEGLVIFSIWNNEFEFLGEK